MKDNEVNKIKTDMIRRHSLSTCKLASRHILQTGLNEHTLDPGFREVFGQPLLDEIREIRSELLGMDTKTAFEIVKRFL